jgi:predicted nucleotide-binding protein
MPVPIRITLEDIILYSNFLSKRAAGATMQEIKSALGDPRADSRKMNGLRYLGIIEEREGKMRATPIARDIAKNKENTSALANILTDIIRKVPPYWAIAERAYHRSEGSLTSADVGSHWHDNFQEDVSLSEETLLEQVTTFFQMAEAAGLGRYVVGRRGSPTRMEFDLGKLGQLTQDGLQPTDSSEQAASLGADLMPPQETVIAEVPSRPTEPPRSRIQGQGIFIAHGKNKKPLEQLKKILDQFKIPYKVAIDEPNLGRPISEKVKETMEASNCAILIFTADEEFKDKDGNTIWRPSENVVFELGASSFLYENRIVIMKEQSVVFPSNYRDIGYITFDKDQLEAKAMEVLRELIGFGIVRVST